MRAIWNGATLAHSDDTVVVDGNHYFPADSIDAALFEESETHTTCSWKGLASYKTVVVGSERNADAAWFYPEPMEGAEMVTDRIAFWHGVEVVE
jgi:uncharacterized protein (DUF427 family)